MTDVDRFDPKTDLHRYLTVAREAVLWKLEGLSEYDLRRPLTPTGTNLLGLVKHLASIELGYFGETFERPSGIPLPWFAEDAEPNADLWVTPEETSAEIIDLYRRAIAHADATIESLDVDAVGSVPWWEGDTTLGRILVHMTAETHRHAGHVDIVREMVDGFVGYRDGNSNLWVDDTGGWTSHHDRVEAAARMFRDAT